MPPPHQSRLRLDSFPSRGSLPGWFAEKQNREFLYNLEPSHAGEVLFLPFPPPFCGDFFAALPTFNESVPCLLPSLFKREFSVNYFCKDFVLLWWRILQCLWYTAYEGEKANALPQKTKGELSMQKTNIFSRTAARVTSLILAGALGLSAVCTGLGGTTSPRTVSAAPVPQADGTAVVDSSTTWRYLDDNTDPAGDSAAEGYVRTSWTAADFDDSSWKTGAGAFGAKRGAIADLGGGCTPDVLLNQYINGNDGDDIPAFFFRTTFEVEDADAINLITGSLLYDDAATVYLNGVKIAGFDDEDITENLQYGGSNASDPITGEINVTDTSMLVDGTNVLAVELHQGRASSSDIYFEFENLTLSETSPYTFNPIDFVMNVGADETEMTFVWYDTTATPDTLVFGGTSYTASTEAASREGYTINTVTVTGLEENTAYEYYIQNGSDKTETYTYTTGDFNPDSLDIAVVGDPQIGSSGNNESDTNNWNETLDTIANDGTDYDFLFSMGDQIDTYYNGSNGSTVEEEYDGYLSSDVLKSLPMQVLVGNHDNGSDSSLYVEHFENPNVTTFGENYGDDGDYAFTYNGVLFMVINTSNLSIAEHEAFLKDALETYPDAQWSIVAFHKSIYSVASHVTEGDIVTLRNGLAPVFTELDIDLVIQGHDHVYARTYIMGGEDGMQAQVTDQADRDMTTGQASFTDPDGVMYVTFNSGSGSKNYRITSEAFPYTDVQYQNNGRSYSHLSVEGNSLTVTTYNLENNDITDTFTITKSIPADSVTLDQTSLTLESGSTATLTATVEPETATDKAVTWSSSNEDVATVDENGVVTALSEGSATITATAASGASASCQVTVNWKVAFDPSNLVMNVGADENQVIFVWYNQTASADTLVFGGQHYVAATEEATQDGYTINRVVINDLQPNTEYSYYIENGDDVSDTYTYTTGEFDSNSLDMMVVGDPQIGASGNNESDTTQWNETLEEALNDGTDYDFLFSLGDQIDTYYNGTNGDDVEAEYDGYLSSELLTGIPMATLVGNHDNGNDSSLYTDHFAHPNVSSYGETYGNGDGDYYFTYNDVLFMVLNSSDLSIAEHKAFLEETLANHGDEAKWTVVAFHKSIYSVASHVTESDIITLRTGLAPIFAQLDIDLVIQGHDHVYARTYMMGGADGMQAQITDEGDRDMTTGQELFVNPDGVMYVTFNSGSGSKNYDITQEAFPYTDVQYQNNGRNYSRLSVDGDSLTVTTYNLENNTVTDTFTITKTTEATGVTLDQSEVSLTEGETAQLSAVIDPENADTTLTWATGNTAVATVDENGLVTAVGAGETTITVTTSNGLTAACTVTVTAAQVEDPDQPGTDNPGATTDPDQNGGADTGNTNTGVSEVPQTGDDAQITLWAVLAMAAAAAVAIPAARRLWVKRNG